MNEVGLNVNASTAAIFGCSGLSLSVDERRFFTECQPVGFILFGRNIETPEQVTSLVAALKSCVTSPNPLILVDQEGGRVARLRPPYWSAYPSAQRIGALYQQNKTEGENAADLVGRLIADELAPLGFNVDCAPVLDVRREGAHDIIGDRAYSDDAAIVARLGRVVSAGLMRGGVLPIIKHIPGHGRAGADSHVELPVVDTSMEALRQTDFAAFRAYADAPMAMTAHVIYSDIDARYPATVSRTVLQTIVRDDIGFDGLLMSDDLSMKALKGVMEERARGAIDAGCDVALHCNGDMAEMVDVASACGRMTLEAMARLDSAQRFLSKPDDFNRAEALEKLETLLKGAA
ncbi:MAG: beta-N-acetylhexosaminidase [Alphaproteobacteria bacterium]|nr:beta-N-acetylhexosaminidase [Alphaproteobacteria bacterium]